MRRCQVVRDVCRAHRRIYVSRLERAARLVAWDLRHGVSVVPLGPLVSLGLRLVANVVKRAAYLRDCVAVGALVPLVLLVADAVRSTADVTSGVRLVSGH